MIPKVLTAFISAAILSAVLGALPCEATGVKPHGKAKAAASSPVTSVGSDLNSPSMDFTGVKPQTENPHPDLIPPKKNKNQFFDQTIR